MQERIHTDVAVIGGGLGGIAATLALLQSGYQVLMSEACPWIGGQVTSQAVPPDEHRYITRYGTRSYVAWRRLVQDYYRAHYPVREEISRQENFNPGGGFVSTLCHEPKVSHMVFTELFEAYRSTGQLILLTEAEPSAAELDESTGIVRSVTLQTPSGTVEVEAPYVIDATECGDLLPLTDTPYVTGAESRDDTGEWHAPDEADPLDMQAVTWCFAISRDKPGTDHRIPKPAGYEHYKQHLSDFWPGSQLSWTYTQPITLEPIESGIEAQEGVINLWRYRQIFSTELLDLTPAQEETAEDITLVNWPQNDYWFGPLFEVPDAEARHHYQEAREISRCWLYWLQTEAPRPGGGTGYPELRLRPDVMGTPDGFAQAPYIRESRRLRHPLTRVTEGDVGCAMREALCRDGQIPRVEATQFPDSVGVGYYRIDLHPSTGGRNYIDLPSLPFQIPLGALIPRERPNLLAGNKNIGTTHITNGCYRLHPVEWNIGEACGHLVAYCLRHHLTPQEVHATSSHTKALQRLLSESGVPLEWPEGLRSGLQ